jgi:hypothetical protein
MKNLKLPLVAVAGLAAFALVATSGGAGASGTPASLDADVFKNAVFANTYVSTGATASTVNGNVVAGTYLTLGATSNVNGNSDSGGITTLGAGADISGDVNAPPAVVFGAGATSGTSGIIAAANVSALASEVSVAQSYLNTLGPAPQPLGNVAADPAYAAGVYNVSGLRTYTANIDITITGCADFIFNATGYITFGAGVEVKRDVSSCATVPRTIWNAGGYISVGAGANIVGTLMAHTYVSVGADAIVRGLTDCGGGIYSATSYVSIGAGATVSGSGDCGETVVCTGEILWIEVENTSGLIEFVDSGRTTCDCPL